MGKIIVERGRSGGRADKGLKKRYRNRDAEDEHDQLDSQPRHAAVHEQHRNDPKDFGETLEPLRRYLEKQVGRPWNKIKSEMQLSVGRRSVIHRHAWTHVDGYVDAENIVEIEGKLFRKNLYVRYGGTFYEPIKESIAYLYVHPRTGLLRKNREYRARFPLGRRWRMAEEKPVDRIETKNPMVQYHKLGGLWYEVQLAAWTELPETKDFATKCAPKDLKRVYGRDGVRGVKKRLLNTKELRAHKLTNDPQEVT